MHLHLYGARSPQRETQALPGWTQAMGGDAFARTHALPKPTPYNLRRFSESPIPRRAINAVKNPVSALKWEIRPIEGVEDLGNQAQRIKTATYCFRHPNQDDSWRSFIEQVTEDTLVGSFGSIEQQLVGNAQRPLWMWPVDGSTIRVYPGWSGKKTEARYAQMTGFTGHYINLRNDELIYIKMNPRTSTPFGLAPLEVAFETINQFLSANQFAGKLAGNQSPRGILNLGEDASPQQVSAYRNYWRNEIEGRGTVPIIGGTKAPAFIPLFRGDDADMRLAWQEFLIRNIAVSFDLSPLALGLERDVNQATADALQEADRYNAIKPMANLIAEYLNREALHRKLGWTDLELVWLDLDKEDDLRKSQIHKTYLSEDVYTPNEIRAKNGDDPLPGEWGNLVKTQRLILVAQAAGTKVESENPALQTLKEAFTEKE